MLRQRDDDTEPSAGPYPELRTTADLIGEGYSTPELARLVRDREFVRVRRGVLVDGNISGTTSTQESDHRRLIAATIGLCADETVISHRSAALLWGLRIDSIPTRVELTRPEAIHGRDRGCVHLRVAKLAPSEITMLDGVPVTTMARTVVDLARALPLVRSVVVGDAALAAGLDAADLGESLERARGRRGVIRARRACAFFDGRSESGGESISRVRLVAAGIPAPALQVEVFDADGVLIGRSDFGWEEHRTLGEFDGRVKYGRLLKPGQTSADVVWAEKRREDALRDTGRQVVRWTWDDLQSMPRLVARIRRAFARAA